MFFQKFPFEGLMPQTLWEALAAFFASGLTADTQLSVIVYL